MDRKTALLLQVSWVQTMLIVLPPILTLYCQYDPLSAVSYYLVLRKITILLHSFEGYIHMTINFIAIYPDSPLTSKEKRCS